MIYFLFVLSLLFNSYVYSFGEEVEIQQLGEIEFYDISDFKIENEHIYIADKAFFKLYKFTENGHLIASSGREGRGPGEFIRGPNQIIPANDSIRVIGAIEPYYYVYDSELNFITNKDDYPELVNIDFMYFQNGTFYGVAYPGLDYHIVTYIPEIDELKTIDLDFEIKAGLLNRFQLLDFDDTRIIAWYYQNKFKIYDQDFSELDQFQIPNIKNIADGAFALGRPITGSASRQAELINAGSFAPNGSFFEEFVVLSNEHFLVQLGQQTGGSHTAMILNKKGEILQEISLPHNGKVLGYSNEILYMLSSDEMNIVAYKFFKE